MSQSNDVFPANRFAAAVIVTPLVAGGCLFATYVLSWWSGVRVFEGPLSDWPRAKDAAISLGVGGTILALIVTGAAVPLLVWMRRRGPLSLGRFLSLGVVLGNLPFALIVLSIVAVQLVKGTLSGDVARLWYGFSGTVRALALGLAIGPTSAAVFWAIVVRGQTPREGTAFAPEARRSI
jgi:hypothetical protein